jgi:branched-chain amino acid transport system ATP-binding protein
MSTATMSEQATVSNAATARTAGKTLLKVSGLKVGYGGIQAVKGVDFEVREGELVSLIGSNGAGKTTTMKAITGTLPAGAGHIEFLGRSIKGRGAWDLVSEGLVMVPEGRGVFTRMTITENLQIGAYIRKDKAEIASDMERVFVTFPRLRERKDQLAGTMSGGEQQMLAMGRALMARPKVLLLDEPTMGLSPIMCDKIFEVVQTVASQINPPWRPTPSPLFRIWRARPHERPNSSGVVGTGSASRPAKRVFASGAFSAATKAWFSFCDHVARRAGRRDQAPPGVDREALERFGHGRHVRQVGRALQRRHRQRLQLARADVRRGGGEVVEVEVDLAGEQRQLRRVAAVVGNVHGEDAGVRLNISPARWPALPLPPLP